MLEKKEIAAISKFLPTLYELQQNMKNCDLMKTNSDLQRSPCKRSLPSVKSRGEFAQVLLFSFQF